MREKSRASASRAVGTLGRWLSALPGRVRVPLVVASSALLVAALLMPTEAAAASCPNWSMNPKGLPGGTEASNLLGGLSWYAMLFCGAGLLIAVSTHQFAKHTRRPELAHHSLHGAGWAMVGALIAGGGHSLIAAAHHAGTAVAASC